MTSPQKPEFITRDIGLAIRDFLEQRTVTHYEDRDGALEPCGDDEVVAVDVSDPDNLTVCLDNGQSFTVRIFAGDAS